MAWSPPSDDVWSRIEFLARTPRRIQTLFSATDEPKQLDGFHDATDIPKTTLRRTLRSLCEHGWLEEGTDAYYRPTMAGRIVAREFRGLLRTVESVDEYVSFAEWLSRDARESLPPEFTECEFVLPTSSNPYAPIDAFFDELADSSTLRGFAPVVIPFYPRDGRETLDVDLEGTFATTPDALDTVATDRDGAYAGILTAEGMDMQVTESIPEYGVAVLDDVTLLVAFDDKRMITATARVTADDGRAYEWLTDRCSAVLAEATPHESRTNSDEEAVVGPSQGD